MYIRSFFMYNRARLSDDPYFRIDSDLSANADTLRVDELRRILASCNHCYPLSISRLSLDLT